MKRENQQDATIRCLLLTSVSTCFGHYYAHLQENKIAEVCVRFEFLTTVPLKTWAIWGVSVLSVRK